MLANVPVMKGMNTRNKTPYPMWMFRFVLDPCQRLLLSLEDSKLLKEDIGGLVGNVATLILFLPAEKPVQ
jgi:hypothetical protein